jgi:TIR domain
LAHDVYIGYSPVDKATAEAVCHRLEGAGIRCWIAPRDIGDGQNQNEAIGQALGGSKLAITVFSPPAIASRHVLNAVAAALDAEITVTPFRAEDIQSRGEMPSPRLHWLDVLSESLDARIRRLIDRVNCQLSGQKDRRVGP